jgi:hypothetical protein
MTEFVVLLILVPAIVAIGFFAYFCVCWLLYKRREKYTKSDLVKDMLGMLSVAVPGLLDQKEKKMMRGMILSGALFIVYTALLMFFMK